MFVRLYWILPLFGTLVWLSMLLAMFLYWVIDRNKASYPSQDNGQFIPYISDIGAYQLQPLFISMATVSVVCLDLALVAERWLRHVGRLAPNTSWFQKILSIISIIAGIVGALGIILLSVYDTRDHPNLHDAFLYIFIVGYIISAIAICWEFQRLGIHFRNHPVLRASFWIKLFFILIEVGLAIAFGVTVHYEKYDASAIVEWILALIFTFYILSFVMDLAPAIRTRHHMSHPAVAEFEQQKYGHALDHGHGTNGVNGVDTENGQITNAAGYEHEMTHDPRYAPSSNGTTAVNASQNY